MPLLLSVKLCLMLLHRLSPHCTGCPLFGPTHAFFPSIATVCNCMEVMDSDAHIYLHRILSLSYTNAYIFSIYVFSLVCTKQVFIYTEATWRKFANNFVYVHSFSFT